MIKAGSQIDVQDDDGFTPLHKACIYTNGSVVKELLKAGADISHFVINMVTLKGWSPLHFACNSNRNIECIQILIQAGAVLDIQNVDKRTPLHIACCNGKVQYIQALLDAGNSKSGIDFNLQDTEGKTALHLAIVSGYMPCVKLLLSYNVRLDILDNNGETSLYTACDRYSCGRYPWNFVTELLKVDHNVNVVDHNGRSMLHVICENMHQIYMEDDSVYIDYKNIVSELLRLGLDISIKNNDGHTALDLARKYGFMDLAKLIEEWEVPIKEPAML